MSHELTELVPGAIWTRDYPIRYSGTRFNARMTIVRLTDGRLWIHSPCAIDEQTRAAIAGLGPVAFIVAPGTYHYFHIPSCQQAFPGAMTFVCPGLERKRPDLRFDRILGERAEPEWQAELDQIPVLGTRFIQEVAFLHRPTRTLILVDLIENFRDETPGTNLMLRLWFKHVFRMWDNPKPAPEYRMGWGNRKAVGQTLTRILDWDFQRIILAHGEVITHEARALARQAWRRPLAAAR